QVFAELGVHLVVALEQRLDGRHAFFDVAEDSLRRIEPRFLLQESDRNPGRRKRFAEKLVVLARHDAEQRALAGTIQTEDANLGPEVEREPDVVEYFEIGRMHLPEAFHGVDELRHTTIYNRELTIAKA